MKLSEAIRLGSMLGPQTFHQLHRANATCARGAALLAIGIKDWAENDEVAHTEWPILFEMRPELKSCEICGKEYVAELLVFAITHLNDQHRWTRERIADWVEQIENEMEAEQVVSVTAEGAIA